MFIENSNHSLVDLLQKDHLMRTTEELKLIKNDKCIQSTLNKIPATKSLLEDSNLPLAVLLEPFNQWETVKLLNKNVVRCQSCRCYLNPFVKFVDGNKWKCNLCTRVNILHYGCMIGEETIHTNVEYAAGTEYNVRPPPPVVHLFVLDITHSGSVSGYLATFLKELLQNLDNITYNSRSLFGIILFDSYVHFMCMQDNFVRELIMCDVEDSFVPVPDGILINIAEFKNMIVEVINIITTRYSVSYDTNCCLGAAVNCAIKLLSCTGGRICIFNSTIPNFGPGKLNNNSTCQPVTDFYKLLALDCVTRQITVDMFVLNSLHCNLATLVDLVQYSAGTIYHFPQYHNRNIQMRQQLRNTLQRYLTKNVGVEAVLRLRCSSGISIKRFYGSCFVRSFDLICLPVINPDCSYAVELTIDGPLEPFIYLQTAVLYTTTVGERYIRVSTLQLPVINNLQCVLLSVNQKIVFNIISKMCSERYLTDSMLELKETLINTLVKICVTYNSFIKPFSKFSFLLPSAISFLPLFILSLLKSDLFEKSINVDCKSYFLFLIKTLTLDNFLTLFTPTCFYKHDKQIVHRFYQDVLDKSMFVVNTFDTIYLHTNDIEVNSSELVELQCLVEELVAYKLIKPCLQVVSDFKNINLPRVLDKTEENYSYYEFLQFVLSKLDSF